MSQPIKKMIKKLILKYKREPHRLVKWMTAMIVTLLTYGLPIIGGPVLGLISFGFVYYKTDIKRAKRLGQKHPIKKLLGM